LALAGDPLATKLSGDVITTRILPFGKETIVCVEDTPPRYRVLTSVKRIQ